MNLQKIKSDLERDLSKATIRTYSKIIKRICALLPDALKIQPGISFIDTGMGSWSFSGKGHGFNKEEDENGEPYGGTEFDAHDIADYIRNGCDDDFLLYKNAALIELVGLLDFLCDVDSLNSSVWQDGFDKNGVVFIHSETSNQNNPFAIPNKQYQCETYAYKVIVKCGIPFSFIDKSEAKAA